MTNDDFVKWINAKYLAWQGELGKKQSVTAWAETLDIDRDVVNQWLNGRRRPSRESADALALVLGADVYDALGYERPPDIVVELNRYLGDLSENDIAAIRAIFAKASARRARQGDGDSVAAADRGRKARGH